MSEIQSMLRSFPVNDDLYQHIRHIMNQQIDNEFTNDFFQYFVSFQHNEVEHLVEHSIHENTRWHLNRLVNA